MKKRYKYYCSQCEEDFYVERANMNERHRCGAFGRLDWAYDGEDSKEED
ncbi:MAG: hypothetical protein AAB738_00195 [Patescibacteria group bacterium]